MRSVLIVCDEYSFLMGSYTWFRRDLRVDRVDVTTNEEEAITLVKSLRPDIVVLDAVPHQGATLKTLRRLREASSDVNIILTTREQCQPETGRIAIAAGAIGAVPRIQLSVEACLRLADYADDARIRARQQVV